MLLFASQCGVPRPCPQLIVFEVVDVFTLNILVFFFFLMVDFKCPNAVLPWT